MGMTLFSFGPRAAPFQPAKRLPSSIPSPTLTDSSMSLFGCRQFCIDYLFVLLPTAPISFRAQFYCTLNANRTPLPRADMPKFSCLIQLVPLIPTWIVVSATMCGTQ